MPFSGGEKEQAFVSFPHQDIGILFYIESSAINAIWSIIFCNLIFNIMLFMIIIVRISFVFVDRASVSMANRQKTLRFARKADSSGNRAGRRFDLCGKRAGKTFRFIKIAGRLTLKFRNGYDNLGRVPNQRAPVFPVRLPNRKRVDSLTAPLG